MKTALISILVALVFLSMVSGCSSLDIQLGNGASAKVKRFMTNMEISKVTVIPEDNGSVSVEIEGLKSDVSAAMETLNKVVEKIP